MRLGFSIVATIVAGTYALLAGVLASYETTGNGCMGWCFGFATLPEYFLLAALPTEFFYSPLWDRLMWAFTIGVIGVNAFILYVIFGGVKWWRIE
jgi:hypothetical protein